MKKNLKIVCVLALVLLSTKGLYGFYEDYFYGNPKKIKASEEKMRGYLHNQKGYENKDIERIDGFYNYKQARGKKYGGIVILNDAHHTIYTYEIHHDKIFELDDIPKKSS
ncbi:hypothetical protein N0B30_22625 (plasmid) [Bacillus subtilis]|nr:MULTISPECIES: hypothetical protein [Bacillus subtilis group]AVB12043.1 hypothetical protein C3438_21515 [Bacillus velezensis]MCT6515427.1 hypothetical protein [Bacillus subtilis]MEC0407588.1 hypothetical protein [Bacillus subtilis]MEC0419533.1 hypothetical protein [Bacillus subtilis]MEC0436841.1 hypothetical protein [Bacillus subtilis]